jgi:alpha-L-fucosidase
MLNIRPKEEEIWQAAEHWWFFNGGMTFDSDVKDPRYAGLKVKMPAQKPCDHAVVLKITKK